MYDYPQQFIKTQRHKLYIYLTSPLQNNVLALWNATKKSTLHCVEVHTLQNQALNSALYPCSHRKPLCSRCQTRTCGSTSCAGVRYWTFISPATTAGTGRRTALWRSRMRWTRRLRARSLSATSEAMWVCTEYLHKYLSGFSLPFDSCPSVRTVSAKP